MTTLTEFESMAVLGRFSGGLAMVVPLEGMFGLVLVVKLNVHLLLSALLGIIHQIACFISFSVFLIQLMLAQHKVVILVGGGEGLLALDFDGGLARLG
mmetsp:Transcript_2232/g.2173  ORF Transcript_2232/g.2173 Transcript_2232/m.2173 type:complete len:98 (-) Transcript_2232:104-397(-)